MELTITTTLHFEEFGTTQTTENVGRWSIWIPREHPLGEGWELVCGLIVDFEMSPTIVTAVPQLEGINEYGEGATRGEALLDLMNSFTDYFKCLEERETESRLHPTAETELEALRRLVQRKNS